MLKTNIKNILQALDIDQVNYFADINFSAPELSIAIHNRFGCKIDILSVDAQCQFTKPDTEVINNYISLLTKAGVSQDAIRIVDSAKTLRPYDIISSIDGFGTNFKIKPLNKILKKCLQPQSRVVMNIKKGSGSYPFLNKYGASNTLVNATADQFGLVVMSVEPKAPPQQDWSVIANEIAGKDGFFTDCGEHSFVYVPRGKTLVVTFDNLDIAMNKRASRRPWGYEFTAEQNWSMLGVMANGWTWFRDPAVTAEFDRLKNSGFFEQFSRVVFYGASMGGYAAAAYSSAAPGATVFTISPQSTVDKTIVPWEMRYKAVWERDFSGPYGDAALVSDKAAVVHIMFDPYVKPDAAHAARFTGANVKYWRCPHLGHRLGSSLAQMGVINEVSRKCINGDLDDATFYKLLRARRGLPRYLRELMHIALEKNHIDLASRVSKFAKQQGHIKLSSQMMAQIQAMTTSR
jgi:hypothetical protein